MQNLESADHLFSFGTLPDTYFSWWSFHCWLQPWDPQDGCFPLGQMDTRLTPWCPWGGLLKTGWAEVWTLDTSATLTKDVVPVGIGFSNGEHSAEQAGSKERAVAEIDPESCMGEAGWIMVTPSPKMTEIALFDHWGIELWLLWPCSYFAWIVSIWIVALCGSAAW